MLYLINADLESECHHVSFTTIVWYSAITFCLNSYIAAWTEQWQSLGGFCRDNTEYSYKHRTINHRGTHDIQGGTAEKVWQPLLM